MDGKVTRFLRNEELLKELKVHLKAVNESLKELAKHDYSFFIEVNKHNMFVNGNTNKYYEIDINVTIDMGKL